MSFRNIISTTALTQVQSSFHEWAHPKTEEHVRDAILYYGEIPFLYRVFDVTKVPSKMEKGRYKVVSSFRPSQVPISDFSSQVRHGIFQNQVIINTMLVYYGKKGTKSCIPEVSVPGENPVGALALVCAAVGTTPSSNHLTTNSPQISFRSNVRC
jgi:hypothetical protein